MKIALYLGSFNPFHNGHLEVIKTALLKFNMDRVVIVPSMQNPWKKEAPISMNRRILIIVKSLGELIEKPSQRYTCGNSPVREWVDISKIERELISPYYSYATLHALKNKYCNDKIFVLCGEDTIKNIPDWMNGGEILKDYDFLVVDRPESSISSSLIREKVRNGEDISTYVSNNVINLIKNYYQ